MAEKALVEAMDASALATVSQLARSARRLEDEIEGLETEVAQRKESLRRIVEEALPVAMVELGINTIKLDDGSTVEVAQFINAGIPKAREAEALAHLRSIGLGDLIKNVVVASYGMGEDEKAVSLVRTLMESGTQWEQKEFVHPSTLKKQVRESIEAGQPLPEDLFGVHITDRAVIKLPKQKAGAER